MKTNMKKFAHWIWNFYKVHRKARKELNSQTGEEIKIKAANAVKFSVGKKLKDAI